MNPDSPLSPILLRDFLKSLGWFQRPEGLAYGLYLFENEKFPKRQLTYPKDHAAPDYGEAVVLVMEKLADMLQQSPQSLWHRALFLASDILRLRLLPTKGSPDSLPLEAVSEIISGTLQLLKSTASTLQHPRAHHSRLGNKNIDKFIESCRFGHTEAGSFVFCIACPLNALEDHGGLDLPDAEPPFTRRVTEKLHAGIHHIVQAIESDSLNQWIHDLKSDAHPAISANFCEALARLYDREIQNTLDIAVDYSSFQPVSPLLQKPIRILPEYFSKIESVGYQLRASEGAREETFVGTVEELKGGEMVADGTRPGEVVLLLMDGERNFRARTALNPEHYRQAHEAHMKKGCFVKVKGYLQPGRQPRQLSLKEFTVLGTS